jgi:hypothetical protein
MRNASQLAITTDSHRRPPRNFHLRALPFFLSNEATSGKKKRDPSFIYR